MTTNSPATYATLETLIALTEEAIVMTAAQEWHAIEPLQAQRAEVTQELNRLIDDTSAPDSLIFEKLRYIRALEEQLISQMEAAKAQLVLESQQLKKGSAVLKAYQAFKNSP